jgi:hypothetical protein
MCVCVWGGGGGQVNVVVLMLTEVLARTFVDGVDGGLRNARVEHNAVVGGVDGHSGGSHGKAVSHEVDHRVGRHSKWIAVVVGVPVPVGGCLLFVVCFVCS